MKWNKDDRRWRKKYRGKSYAVTLYRLSTDYKNLFKDKTEAGSRAAAEAWWQDRLKTIEQEKPKRIEQPPTVGLEERVLQELGLANTDQSIRAVKVVFTELKSILAQESTAGTAALSSPTNWATRQSAEKKKPPRTLFTRHGNRRRVAADIWKRLGDPELYIEPFLGTGAVLLLRPQWDGKRQIANDLDPFVINFFRAMKYDADDLAARWSSFFKKRPGLLDLKEKLRDEKSGLESSLQKQTFFDTSIAGDWYYGTMLTTHGSFMNENRTPVPMVNRYEKPSTSLIHSAKDRRNIRRRLQQVDLYCGDWTGVLHHLDGRTSAAIFLDPPYRSTSGNYYVAQRETAREVAAWAFKQKTPKLRISLCGFDGDYSIPRGWSKIAGKPTAGKNRDRDRIWFSPNATTDDTRRRMGVV
jgi:site-specific DNA-adenine methylase